MPSALIVDDSQAWRKALGTRLEAEGFSAELAEDLRAARAALGGSRYDLVLLDLQLPDGSGLDLLPDLEAQHPIHVVFVTGHASVDSAVQAFRGGAVDYLTKPIDLQRLKLIAANVRRTLALEGRIDELRGELRQLGRFGSLIGASPSMQSIYDAIEQVAPTDATVFVTGETGTGKELVAETVHQLSRRATEPFVPINCGAIAASLIESELFGHERGSFTGAERQRRGVFEQASGGTLFLDEIGEMPIELQVKLLRVLETGTVTRLGADTAIPIDVRIVAATNRDPREAVTRGELREDLLYRLMVFPIELPPLRDRDGDVELLAEHFLALLNAELGTRKRLSADALTLLGGERWQGNVRELKHRMERAFIVADGELGPQCLQSAAEHGPGADEKQPSAESRPQAPMSVPVGTSLADAEQRIILATLAQVGGNRREAAGILGISVKTLYNRLRSYGTAD